MAAAVVMRAGDGELRASRRLDRAPTLDRGGVQQHDAIPIAWAVAGEGRHQSLHLLGQAGAALPVGVLGRQQRKQPAELAASGAQELAI
jgi:hypothetical protein